MKSCKLISIEGLFAELSTSFKRNHEKKQMWFLIYEIVLNLFVCAK